MQTRKELTVIAHCIAIMYAKKKKMREDLCGMCAIASAGLVKLMDLHDEIHGTKFKAKVVYWNEDDGCHYYVVSKGKVFDATYCQFGSKPIHAGWPTKWHKFETKRISKLSDFFIHKSEKPKQETVDYFLKMAMKGNLLELPEDVYESVNSNLPKYSQYN